WAPRSGWASDGRVAARPIIAARMPAAPSAGLAGSTPGAEDAGAEDAGALAGAATEARERAALRDGATGPGTEGAAARGAGPPAASRSTRSTSSAKGTSRLIWTIFRSASSRVTRGSCAQRRSVSSWVSTSRMRSRSSSEYASASGRRRSRSSGTSDASSALPSGAGGDDPEVVLLAAGEDRVGQLVVLGGGEDELHPGRRLLQRLQERVEGARRKHVDLVDDPDAEAVTGRVVARALPQLADLVDAVVGGAVDLLDVEAGPGGDLPARVALPARIRRRPLHAVEGLGQDARRRRLADTARAREKERVADAARRQRVAQRAGDGGLAHDLVEGLGPPLTREDEVGHGRAGADRT